MSQTSIMYGGVGTATTVEAFRNRPCSKPEFFGYVPPTPEEVRSLRLLLGLSQTQLGCFLGKRFTKKGCSIVRKWEREIGHADYREISYNCWRRMLVAAGVVEPAADLLIAQTRHTEILNSTVDQRGENKNGSDK